MNDSVITDAEGTLFLYRRMLRNDGLLSFPRSMLVDTLDTIESLLDLLAQYNVENTYGIDDDMEYNLNPDDQEFDLDPHLGTDDDEADYES